MRIGEGSIQESAQSLLDELVEAESANSYAEALERERGLDIDEVVAELIGVSA